jgi:23S rRNA pseudouridine1911/1915/1917 synthase
MPAQEASALIDFGSVYVQGRIARDPSRMLSPDEEISVTFPPYGVRKFYELDPARILFRDRFMLAYDKEAGIPSQQTPYDAYNNVFAALLRYLAGTGQSRPYAALHHRLDRETSGLMIFALEKKANNLLGSAFQEKHIKKQYLALVEGSPERESWTEDREIGKKGGKYKAVNRGEGKNAKTEFQVMRREESRALILAAPLTGRTHQIRIHLAQCGHPIVGDTEYGAEPERRLYLHAWRLTLKHPISGKSIDLEAPIPPEFNRKP